MITKICHKRNVIVSQWLLSWGEVRKNVWFVKIDKLKIQSNVFRQLKFSEVILYQRRQKSLWLVSWQILRFNRFNLLFWKLWIHWVKQALPFLYLSLASYIFVQLNKRKFSMPFKFTWYFVQVVCSVYFLTFTWHHFVHSHYFDKNMHLSLFKVSLIVENVNSEYVLNFYLLNESLTTETLMHVFLHLSKWYI